MSSDLEKLILSNIRRSYNAGRSAPTQSRLYNSTKKQAEPAEVDAALYRMLGVGLIGITDGMYFEIGQLEDNRHLVAERKAKARERRKKKGLPADKIDNRKASKVPRGMKPSAAARTLSLLGGAK